MADHESFDRLLQQSLRRDTSAVDCPDSSALAAFAEGTLSAGERQSLETHASSCARCCAELALLARTADDVGASRAQVPGFPLHWRWAVPLATAVLVFLVWSETDRRQHETDIREDSQRTAVVPAERDAPQTPPQPPPLERPEALPEPISRSARAPRVGAPLENRQFAAGADGPAPRAKAAEGPTEAAPSADLQAGTPAAGGRGAEQRQRESRTEAASAPAPLREPQAARTVEPEPPRPRAVLELHRDTVPLLLRASPDVLVRVVPAGIERSTDDGGTWRLERPAPADTLRAGVCPTTTVCWLGGDGGLVLRRDPSGQWTESRLPAVDAVRSIDAADEARATVTIAGGTRFGTSDGGRTWSPFP